MSIINLEDLPTEIIIQLPISLQLETSFELDELDLSTRLLIEQQYNPILNPIDVETNDILDGTFNFGSKNDVEQITVIGDLIIELLQNYFKIPYNAYPYDPTYGHELKPHLSTRDISLRQELISSEITKIVNTVSKEIDIPVSLIGISINNIHNVKHTDVIISLNLKIGDDITLFKENRVLTISNQISER